MAAASTFAFEILTMQKLFLQEQVEFVIAPGQEGLFEILAHHAPYVFALKPGVLRLRLPDQSERLIAIGSGFLVVQKDRTVVLARSAEHPAEIDVERANRAKERAAERLQTGGKDLDAARAQAALQRALARLKTAEYVSAER